MVTALHFYVKPDVTALNTSVDGIHRDISRIDDEIKSANTKIDTVLNQANSRIDTVLNQAMDKALGAVSKTSTTLTPPRNQGGVPQDDAYLRNGLNKIRAVLDLATASSAKLGRERVIAVSSTLKDLTKSEPELSRVAWDTMASLLHYNSETTASPAITWLGPAKWPLEDGFPGLFGSTEMKNIELYASEAGVDLRRGALLLPLRIEDQTYQRRESTGKTTWPEFEMVVGADDSRVVLDKLHIRNVVLKHLRIVYGGGKAVLENVTFIDCTFDLIKTQRTVEFSDVLLKEQAINFGL